MTNTHWVALVVSGSAVLVTYSTRTGHIHHKCVTTWPTHSTNNAKAYGQGLDQHSAQVVTTKNSDACSFCVHQEGCGTGELFDVVLVPGAVTLVPGM